MRNLLRQIEVTLEALGLAERFVEPGVYRLRRGAPVGSLLKKAARGPALPPLTMMIEGERVSADHRLLGGERVRVFQLSAGG